MMNRFAVILSLLLVGVVFSKGQPRWDWVTPVLGNSFVEGNALARSPNGDLIFVGTFNDSLFMGDNRVAAIGNYDVFSTLLTNKGAFRKGETIGGVDVDECKSVVFDNKGNAYICGTFTDAIVIGSTALLSKEEFGVDVFLAKINKFGIVEWAWADGAPTTDDDVPYVAVDSIGSVYLTGSFSGTLEFGEKTAISAGKLDSYVVKISSAGAITWLQRFGGSENDIAKSISVSPNGDRIYTTGTFSGTANFGGKIVNSFPGSVDFYVLALTANGPMQFVHRYGNVGPDVYINGHADKDGKLIVVGGMSGEMAFDTQTLKAKGEFAPDLFVTRVAKDGAFELLKSYGGTNSEVGLGVASDPRGGLFVVGFYDSTADFSGTILNSAGGRDGFIAKIHMNGTMEWVRDFGGLYDDEARSVVVDENNIPYIGGMFDTRATFGHIDIKGIRFTDAFVAALECGPYTAVTPMGPVINICEGQDQELTSPAGYPAYEWFVNSTSINGATKFKFMLDKLPVGTHKVYVRITDFYNCAKNSDTLTIEVREGLPIPMITKDNTTLTCSVDDVMYQWYYEGKIVNSANKKTFETIGQGNYRVKISDETGCNRWSDNFLVGTTDVIEPGVAGNGLGFYPNPVSDVLNVVGVNNANIVLNDATGRTLRSYSNVSGDMEIPMNLAPGMYVLRVEEGGVVRVGLVVRKN